MKKYFTFGLIMSLVPGACFAEHPMIVQLIQEKQQKMEKLEKCKGTTKNLKIAGISTLGITAVGVGANIAEAVVLSNTKDDVKKAQAARDAQLEIKGNRQEFEQFCNEIGGDLVYSGSGCVKYAADIDEYNSLVSMMRQKFSNCQATANPLQERCVDKDKRGVSIILREQNDQNKDSGQGNKEQDEETTQNHVINETLSLAEIANKIKEILQKPESKCSDASTKATWSRGYTWSAKCDKVNHIFTFAGVKCDNNQKFDIENGECLAEAEAEKPLEQRCKERHPNGSPERLACCYAGSATTWDDKTNTCSCKESNQQWQGGKCVPKPDNGNKGGNGGNGGQDGKGGANDAPVKGATPPTKSCNIGWRWNAITKECEKLGPKGEKNFGQCGEGEVFDGQGCVTLNIPNDGNGGSETQPQPRSQPQPQPQDEQKEQERQDRLSKLDDNTKINYVCRDQKQEQGRTVNTDGVASYCADAQTEDSCNELNNKLQNFYPKTARFEWSTITFGDGAYDNAYTYNEQISGMATRPELKVREVTRCWIRR